MSQRSLEYNRLVGTPGVLTDAASVVLADPTGSFGVQRADTGAVVVAAGTAMFHAATGVYTYGNQTGDVVLDGGIAYAWYAKVTDADGTVEYVPFTAPVVSSHYGSRTGVEALAGIYNVAVFADLQTGNGPNADPAYIASRIETALADADSIILAEFTARAGSVPDPTSPYYGRLATIANHLAISFLYRPRSLNDKNIAGYLAAWEATAEDGIRMVAFAMRRDRSIASAPAIVA